MKHIFMKTAIVVCISITALVSVVSVCRGASDFHVSVTLPEGETLDNEDKKNKYLEYKKKALEDRLCEYFPDEELALELSVSADGEITGAELMIAREKKPDTESDYQLKKYIADFIGVPMSQVMIMGI